MKISSIALAIILCLPSLAGKVFIAYPNKVRGGYEGDRLIEIFEGTKKKKSKYIPRDGSLEYTPKSQKTIKIVVRSEKKDDKKLSSCSNIKSTDFTIVTLKKTLSFNTCHKTIYNSEADYTKAKTLLQKKLS